MLVDMRVALLSLVICACSFPRPPEIVDDAQLPSPDAGPIATDFAVTLASPRVRIVEGTSATVEVTIGRNEFTEPVTVTVGGLPAGVTVSPLTIAADSGTLTLDVAAGATQGDAALTVTATGGARAHDAALSLLAMGLPGTLDKSFATGGILMTPPTGFGTAMVIQPDGKIVIAGHTTGTTPDLLVARFLPGGALDPAFAGGVVTLASPGMNDRANAMTLQPDGKIVVVGETFATDENARSGLVARFKTDGIPDPAFGTGGRVELDLSAAGHFNRAKAVAVQADGGIVVAGIYELGGSFDPVVARLAPGGGLDNSFGMNGRVRVPLGSGIDGFAALRVQSDGRILAVGTTSSGTTDLVTLVRLTSGGLLDSTFDSDGKLLINGWEIGDPIDDWQTAIAFQPDGKIVVAGSAWSGAGFDACLLRVNSNDGSPDAGFGTNGVKVVSLAPGHLDRLTGLALQPDGKLVLGGSVPIAAGSTNYDAVAARFSSEGVLDFGFGAGGIATHELGGDVNATDQPRAIALDADGRIVTGGFSLAAPGPEQLLLARFWP